MADDGPSLELKPPVHAVMLGRKGSGKSVLAAALWRSWPGDGLVIDPTGDAAAHDTTSLTEPLPTRWPRELTAEDADPGRRRRPPSRLRYVPDPGSKEWVEDMDRAVGLAFTKGDALVWLDEVGELTRANATPPAMRRLLHQGRHRRCSLLACGPRPVDIDPLVIAQADILGIFRTPNPNDRRRLADVMGLELTDLDAAHDQLEEHGYLWWDAIKRELFIMPPLPRSVVLSVDRPPERRPPFHSSL